MSYYHPCPHCEARLDPGEKCDCTEATAARLRLYVLLDDIVSILQSHPLVNKEHGFLLLALKKAREAKKLVCEERSPTHE